MISAGLAIEEDPSIRYGLTTMCGLVRAAPPSGENPNRNGTKKGAA